MSSFDPGFDACALVSQMVTAIVSEPDGVKVIPIVSSGGYTTLRVIVAKNIDKGRLIGKAGRTAHSLRIILQAAMRQKMIALRLEIVDESEARSLAAISPAHLD